MKVKIEVELDIELIEEGDPATGDPLEHRLRYAAVEAVSNQLQDGMANGFHHDMDSLTSIMIGHVKLQGSDENACYDLLMPLCPDCGEPAEYVFEKATVAIGLKHIRDGLFDVGGFSEDVPDEGSTPIFDRDGQLEVRCCEGHLWQTKCRINRPDNYP